MVPYFLITSFYQVFHLWSIIGVSSFNNLSISCISETMLCVNGLIKA